MQYQKKFLALKSTQSLPSEKPFNFLVRIEIENCQAVFCLSASNFYRQKQCSYHALVIDGDKKQFEFDLKETPNYFCTQFNSLPNLEKGFAVGVYSVQNFIPLTLAFGSQGKRAISITDFNKLIAQKQLSEYSLESDHLSQSENAYTRYNDEAVATQNYYELDQEISQKLLSIKEKLDDDIALEDELFKGKSRTQEKEVCPNDFACQNETSIDFSKENLERSPYYLEFETQLDQLFCCYPEEPTLTRLFKDSKWAKINYTKAKYYVVGLVDFEDGQKYICYGVPGKYAPCPPEPLKGFASFVPKSVFDLQGEGFWIMFQDAISGNCVHLD